MYAKRIIPCLDIRDGKTVKGIKFKVVERISREINIPFTVGGGVSSVEDADILLQAGADKVSINSAAVKNPQLICELKEKFGSQFIVVAIDAKKVNGEYVVTTHGGNRFTDIKLYEWAVEAEKLGAGEILFTSMDCDGTKKGYDCQAYTKLAQLVNIPIIASGGAGSIDDIVEVLSHDPGADAALAASIFHYGSVTIPELKKALKNKNIPVRI